MPTAFDYVRASKNRVVVTVLDAGRTHSSGFRGKSESQFCEVVAEGAGRHKHDIERGVILGI